ncbi:MAG: hypothetical protein AAF620_01015, partial [Bacteroidota bacterium]
TNAMKELTSEEVTQLDRIEQVQNRMVDIKVKLALEGIDDMNTIRSDQEYRTLENEYNELLALLPS